MTHSKRFLFIHQNFPGQFVHISQALAQEGHQVLALSITGRGVPGVTHFRYKIERGNTAGLASELQDFETKTIRAEACLRAMVQLKEKGFDPDLIIAHPGWGESIYCKDVFPNTPLLHFMEYFYASSGGDSGFDPEYSDVSLAYRTRITLKNANHLLALHHMDYGLSPTEWQRSTVPLLYQPRIKVIFDGVDTDRIQPLETARFQIPDGGPLLDRRSEVVTFINRNLEPYRGYHQFMRALPELMKARPDAHVVVVGDEGVSYGAAPPPGKSWKQVFLDEVASRIDLGRLHYLGRVSHDDLLKLYQVSSCHVYLTYPFVLSWSCVEAMSAGCVVVGSNTPPVQELIEHGINGYLVDFFDATALARQVVSILANPKSHVHISVNARQTVLERYDLNRICLPRQIEYVKRIAR